MVFLSSKKTRMPGMELPIQKRGYDTLNVRQSQDCKSLQADLTGLGIVVLKALVCRPWWQEDELAATLCLPIRPVRKFLRLLETVSTQPFAPGAK